MDVTSVTNRAEFAARLDELRRAAGLTYAQLDANSGKRLPKGTVSEMLGGKSLPTEETLRTFLVACRVPAAELPGWLDLLHRIRADDRRVPANAVRVRDANPRHLGVHAAIRVGDTDADDPAYIERDLDQGWNGLQRAVEKGARAGTFILLVGHSSTGKTRSAFEAIRRMLPEWWLVHPDRSEDVAAFAEHPVANSVVWLDELHRYVSGDPPLDDGTVRQLLRAPAPVMIVGTLWPEQYAEYTSFQVPYGAHAKPRTLVDLANVIVVEPRLSDAELDRARRVAEADPRVRAALASGEYGLTQTLAAGPHLLRHWQNADPYARAVIAAAVDLTRLGVLHPISATCLRAAARGYCSTRERAAAKPDWFDTALAYATKSMLGAAAALRPEAVDMGEVDGYTVADFLQQQAGGARHAEPVPDSAWQAAVEHVGDVEDLGRLARGAERTLRYRYAVDLYRRISPITPADALRRAALLALRGEFDELGALADGGDDEAGRRLAELLVEHDRIEELTRRADGGDEPAARRLAGVLVRRDDVGTLTSRALAGDWAAMSRLADHLVDAGAVDRAVLVMRTFMSTRPGHVPSAVRLADLLAERGDTGWAIEILEGLPEDSDAASRLADLLVRNDEDDEAIALLEEQAGNGDWSAPWRLAGVLADRGDVDELRARSDGGDDDAAWRLADLLRSDGRLDEAAQLLRRRAEAGNAVAAYRLAELLERHAGDVAAAAAVLQGLMRGGDGTAAGKLADLMARHGEQREAEELLRERADAGDPPSAWQLAELLAGRGAVDELTRRADGGDRSAAWHLAELLVERADAGALVTRINAGDQHAADLLPTLLTALGRSDEATWVKRLGLNADGSIARP
ncbi:hypothetical protein ACFFX1_43080 [Dactylosporangium sucinum]|uniref:HTH cro/C1-type domain-containing protein n=1 Tax=Dactylosporangium sucinum TaxID=1424081 RepID=A0A917TZT4_9ACTN|nr:transcriptional regulator [Dactylosporangium sucinum]GGM45125.1 hypothetical protein GCM10007977_053320 [Dactylosporangium sucinum]